MLVVTKARGPIHPSGWLGENTRFGAMLGLIANQRFHPADNVLCWHTGGTPARFACEQELVARTGLFVKRKNVKKCGLAVARASPVQTSDAGSR